VWRGAEPLTEDATADRVRWQLDGWLNTRIFVDRPTTPVTLLRLQAVEVVSAGGLQLPPWGGLGDEGGWGGGWAGGGVFHVPWGGGGGEGEGGGVPGGGGGRWGPGGGGGGGGGAR